MQKLIWERYLLTLVSIILINVRLYGVVARK